MNYNLLNISGKIVEKNSTYSSQQKKIKFMSAQRVLVAALSGFVAGVAVGLMVAPASGSEIRQRIADSASDFAGGVRDKIRNMRGKAEDELDDLGLDTAGDSDYNQ